VTLNNPFLLSSAPPSRSREMIARAFDAGWGGAVIKTLTQVESPARRNVTPRIRAIRDGKHVIGFTNMELASMHPTEQWLADLAAIKNRYPTGDLGASMLYGGRPDEKQWRAVARACEEAGVDCIELNLSCPHGGAEDGGRVRDRDAVRRHPDRRGLGAGIGEASGYRQTSGLQRYRSGNQAARAAGADAVAVINTLNALSGIDLDTWLPVPSVAGESAFCVPLRQGGEAVALRCVGDGRRSGGSGLGHGRNLRLARRGGVPACGGVVPSGLFGCHGTRIRHHRRPLRRPSAYLKAKGLSRPSDLTGKALPFIAPHAALSREACVVAACREERSCAADVLVSCRDAGYQAIAWRRGSIPGSTATPATMRAVRGRLSRRMHCDGAALK
jgi:dihydropyrimidine dehydrogenase (NAD+) subunit PreA